jgi:hypothetical protein
MGTEFIAKTRKSTKKYLDRSRADLCAQTLFKADPGTATRQFIAKAEGPSPAPGESVQISSEGANVIISSRGRVIGRNSRPSPGLSAALAKAGGFFPGSICSVHPLSSTFEFKVSPVSGSGGR